MIVWTRNFFDACSGQRQFSTSLAPSSKQGRLILIRCRKVLVISWNVDMRDASRQFNCIVVDRPGSCDATLSLCPFMARRHGGA